MRQGARTDPCGGRGATRVPTATWNETLLTKDPPKGFIGLRILAGTVRQNSALIGIFASRICRLPQKPSHQPKSSESREALSG